jgi:hypothetical protein
LENGTDGPKSEITENEVKTPPKKAILKIPGVVSALTWTGIILFAMTVTASLVLMTLVGVGKIPAWSFLIAVILMLSATVQLMLFLGFADIIEQLSRINANTKR